MFKTFIIAAVAITLVGGAAITTSTEAEAHGGIGLGIAAGLVTGAVVGSAIVASQDRYYDGDYTYCRHVRFVDDYGHVFWRRVCHRD